MSKADYMNGTALRTGLLAALALAAALVLGAFASAQPAWAFERPWEGNGTQGNPFVIDSESDLRALAKGVAANDGIESEEETENEYYVYDGYYFKLADDIVLTSEWDPIGGVFGDTTGIYCYFSGHFDGGGHVISGLSMDYMGGDSLGLFGLVRGKSAADPATIDNVTVRGTVTVRNGSTDLGYMSRYIGGVAGWATYANLSGVRNEVDVLAAGDLYAADDVGGVVGWLSGGVLSACANAGTVSGTGVVGGIAGYLAPLAGTESGMTDCYNVGEVHVYDDRAGGLAGEVETQSQGSALQVARCYTVGQVVSHSADALMSSDIGALFGCTGTSANAGQVIAECYALEGAYGKLHGFSALSLPADTVAFKTRAQMTDDSFSALLGAGFKSVSDGFPRLAWETSGEPIVVTQPQDASYLVSAAPKELFVGATLPSGYDGASADYSVRYEWRRSASAATPLAEWEVVPGAAASFFAPPTAEVGTTYYYCRVYNMAGGSVRSAIASVSVYSAAAQPPSAVAVSFDGMGAFTEAISREVAEGDAFVVGVQATPADAGDTLVYQWQRRPYGGQWADMALATDAQLAVPAAELGTVAYRCAVRAAHEVPGNLSDIVYSPEVSVVGAEFAIRSARDLVRLAQLVNDEGMDFANRTIEVAADVDLEGVEFTPIGTAAHPFAGRFEGNGHRISGLAVTKATDGLAGLFGAVVGVEGRAAVVRDLVVDGSVSIGAAGGSATGAAGVAGFASFAGFYNVGNEVSVNVLSGGSSGIGGMVGRAGGSASIDGCYNRGAVSTVGERVGGLVGYADKLNATVSSSYNTAPVEGADYVGGLVGSFANTDYDAVPTLSMAYCYSSGAVSSVDVDGQAGRSGAIVGMYNNSNFVTLKCSSCYYDSQASGTAAERRGSLTGVTAYATATLKSAVSALNNGKSAANTLFEADSYSINGGYPVLGWENAGRANGPRVTAQPQSVAVQVGQQASLSVSAVNPDGTAEGLGFAWELAQGSGEFAAVPRQASDTFAFVPDAPGTYRVRCLVSCNGVTAVTAVATVTAYEPAAMPENGSIVDDLGEVLAVGDTLVVKQYAVRTLTASATVSDGTLSYAWYTSASAADVNPKGKTPVSTSASCKPDTTALGAKASYYYCIASNRGEIPEAASELLIGPVKVDVVEFSIDTAEDLADFAASVNAGMFAGTSVKVTADINLADLTGGRTFAPIGIDTSRTFTGTFDGQGHSITMALSSSQRHAGLFGMVCKNLTIRDLVVEGSVESSNMQDPCVSALVAYASMNRNAKLTIENVGNNASVRLVSSLSAGGRASGAGGLVGVAAGDGDIVVVDSYNHGDVTGGGLFGAGGLVGVSGAASGALSVRSSYNSGAVSSTRASGGAGGLVGALTASGTSFSGCYSTDGVSAGSGFAGALVGQAGAAANVEFAGCFFDNVKLSAVGDIWGRPVGTDAVAAADMAGDGFVGQLNATADKWIAPSGVIAQPAPSTPGLYWEGVREAVAPEALQGLQYAGGGKVVGVKGGRGYTLSAAPGSSGTVYIESGDAKGVMPGSYAVVATLVNGFVWCGESGSAATAPKCVYFDIARMRLAVPEGLDLPYCGREQVGVSSPGLSGLSVSGGAATLPGSYTAKASISSSGQAYYEWDPDSVGAPASASAQAEIAWRIHALDLSSEVEVSGIKSSYEGLDEFVVGMGSIRVKVAQTGAVLPAGGEPDSEMDVAEDCEYEVSFSEDANRRGVYVVTIAPVRGNVNLVGEYKAEFTLDGAVVIDTAELAAVLADAKADLASVTVAPNGSGVSADSWWMNDANWEKYGSADTFLSLGYWIDAAERGLKSADLSQRDVDGYIAGLLDAMADFDSVKRKGSKQVGSDSNPEPASGPGAESASGAGTGDGLVPASPGLVVNGASGGRPSSDSSGPAGSIGSAADKGSGFASDSSSDSASNSAAGLGTASKAANPLKVKVATKTVKFAKLKTKKRTVKGIVVKKAAGKVTFSRVAKGSSPRLSVSKGTGKVTVKKGTLRGTYKIRVKVNAAGDDAHRPAHATVTVKVKVA